ncbi:ribosomal protein 60S [Calocera viscosa TUFC12733]|uniref:Ribosomal protein 60S n=1 Tax=Calocera viscosa (strain TUFC12733) TaxID=1330018 RepID=A0A167S5B3_CALVF|nr:ribosomal protein 60S [Calocera viscosa TUFC12733]
MRYIAAYLLLQIGGNASPSASDIKSVLTAGGVDADEERVEKLISELKGKSINELIAEGASKLSSVPSGGAVSAGGAAPAAAAGGAAAAEEAPKEEEKKEEEKEESDDDMGFGLFD